MVDYGQMWDDISPPNPRACPECSGINHHAEWCSSKPEESS